MLGQASVPKRLWLAPALPFRSFPVTPFTDAWAQYHLAFRDDVVMLVSNVCSCLLGPSYPIVLLVFSGGVVTLVTTCLRAGSAPRALLGENFKHAAAERWGRLRCRSVPAWPPPCHLECLFSRRFEVLGPRFILHFLRSWSCWSRMNALV